MTDLTSPAERGARNDLAARVDVLDKVGVLSTLPDDVHVTTDMVAEFYGVGRETVANTIKRNRDEFDEDGYRVVTRGAFEERFEMNLPSSASMIALFPRRAVVRVGMLLRDSDVAKRIRTYLLDTEQSSRDATVTFLIPKTLPDALRLAADQAERADRAELQAKTLSARIEKDAPLVAKAEAHSVSDSAAVHRQMFAREVQAWGNKQGINILHEHVYELLRRKGMTIAGDRSDRNHATSHAVKSGWAWTKKDVTEDGHATATTYLRPRGQDLAWKWIAAHVAEFGDLRPQAVSA
jgi:phage antirepressor YoqD-like protein